MWSAEGNYEILRGQKVILCTTENMAALKVFVLLAVIGSLSLALQLPFSKDTYIPRRIGRQVPSPQCQQDYLDLTSNGCFTLFGDGSTGITAESAKQFCRDGCSSTLDGLFKKLIADCGDFAKVSVTVSVRHPHRKWLCTVSITTCASRRVNQLVLTQTNACSARITATVVFTHS